LNRMARAVAHHFNNQLQVVTGNLELALATPPHGAMWSAQCLADALQAARRTAEVNGGLLTYLGSTRGKQEPMDFAEVCRSSLPVLTAAMPGKVTVEADLPAPGPIVKTNAALVCQMLTQLVTNAVEAMEKRPGEVRLRVGTLAPEEAPAEHRFPIDAKPPAGPCACLEVTEPGCGIAEGDLKDLFDPYYSNKFPGRGMGLALVLGIVRAHEGAIAVESKPGRGTTFRVYLPLAAEAVAPPPGKGAAVSDRGKVLLAEDDEGVRMMTAKLLARMGFEVIQAVDGAEAVELFAKHKDEIRWVLSDVRMPRMDGWEVLATVRKLCPGVPVVLATGYDPAFMDADHHPDQPQVVLSKPYGVAELQKAIQKVIAEGKADMLKGKRGRDTDCEKG
ncbi:MAG: ATP-binding protein, partial [Verrucomicrobiota bacterium]